jgi:hypothetical protein
MFFVVQRIETKSSEEGKDPQVQLGVVSEHDTQEDANKKADDVSKTAPGTFFVTKALAVWRPAPKMESIA